MEFRFNRVSCRLAEKRHGKTDKLFANGTSLDDGEEEHLRITADEPGIPARYARFCIIRDTRAGKFRKYRREIRDNAGKFRINNTEN